MVEAALVKDVATLWQQALPENIRNIMGGGSQPWKDDALNEAINQTLRVAPKVTIQGGTTEVLRGMIARGIGLR
jgi:hypothetical protein